MGWSKAVSGPSGEAAVSVVGWGLVGASTIAREWMLGAIRAQPGHRVEVVMSGNLARAQRFAAEHGIAQATDALGALLANPAVHAVYISSTNEQHRDQAVAAARAGKHVLCEKPLALNLTDAQAIITACREAGVVLATNHHLRNAATHRKMRQLLREGAIGRPLYARVFHAVQLRPQLQGWRVRAAAAQGGGVVLDITVHDADTLRFLLDAEPLDVCALTGGGGISSQGAAEVGGTKNGAAEVGSTGNGAAEVGSTGNGAAEVGAMALLRFDNGVIAQLHDAFDAGFADTGVEIHGSHGALIGRNIMSQSGGGEVFLRKADGEHAVAVQHHNLYAAGLQAFDQALRGQGPVAATGEDGLRSLAVALAVLESARSGMRVSLAH